MLNGTRVSKGTLLTLGKTRAEEMEGCVPVYSFLKRKC